MTKHLISLPVAIWFATSCAATPPAIPSDPAEAAKAFYTGLRGKPTGLPKDEAWAALKPRVTPELAAAIEAAQNEQARFMKEQPDEKPPWIEGDLFSSLFEGWQEFSVGKARIKGESAQVPLAFSYTEGGSTSKWTDTIILARPNGSKGWLVEDLHYGGGWDFSNKGTLLDALAPAPDRISPDGRFEFVPFSADEVDAGKPAFGVLEKATGKLIWSAPDDLGDPERPEETILWSPNSRRFALTSRTGTRHLSCFLFGWKDSTFVPLSWKDSARLEELTDLKMLAEAKRDGFTKNASLGQLIVDDTVPVRWVGTDELVVRRTIGRTLAEGEKHGAFEGTARVLLRWNAKIGTFAISRDLGLFVER